ncbi:hypothetical protein K435DRAFT_836797 [Dendrothele bispora CBS 962.96]|uniref:DUF6534 domain-containing protein n=1 Tax=Dendrothele bispora (strain CBS 962.96) TaxID=1314807 RepID=A0A4S8MFT0_DENBC|nr:hypothetical protein K435DRAFT_836797 [Dendrothele bispora CBS 962.96]
MNLIANVPGPDELAQGADLGLIELAIVISSVLYGISLIQTYNYFTAAFKNDKFPLKLMVGILIVFETAHTISLWIYLYRLTVLDFQNTIALSVYSWDVRISIIFAGILCLIAQVFYSYRVFILSQMRYYFSIYTILAVFRFGFSITLAVLPVPDITGPVSQFPWLMISGCALGAFIDLSNAIALCIFLRNKQSSAMESTNQLINKLILWGIQTGLLTSICNVLQLIMLIAMRDNFTWFFFFIQSAKLYTNVVLASLNGRISLRTAQAKSHILPASIGERGNHSEPNQLEVHIEMSVDRFVTRPDSPSSASGEVTSKMDAEIGGLGLHVVE